MLENASQHIASDFDVSQELWNVPSGCTALQRVAGPSGNIAGVMDQASCA